MKKNKMFILLGVFVVLVGCYFGLTQWNKSQEQKEKDEAAQEAVKVKTFDEITEISYKYNENEFDFIKKDDTWFYKKDEHFPLEQSYLETMEDAFSEISAERELKDGDALADYGLEEPAYTIRLKNEDGEETSIYIGDSVNDSYYMTVGDKSKIYTVASTILSPIQYELEALISNDAFPYIPSGKLEQVDMTKGDKTKTFVKEADDEEAEEDSEASEEEGDAENDDSTEKTDSAADAMKTLESTIGGIALSDCADYYMEETEAATYGMDEKNVTKVDVKYTDSNEKEQEFTFYIGATDTEGKNRFVKLGDSHIVYKVDRTKFQEMDTLFEK